MLADIEPPFLGNLDLALFNFRVVKFFNPGTLQANQVVVVSSLIELEHCLAAFKVVAGKQPGLLELREHPVYRRQTDIEPLAYQ